MIFKFSSHQLTLLALCGSTLALSACGTPYKKPMDLEEAQYWQRKNSSSALYLQGPKAQQMLHQNIASCTSEIKELQNLGEIRRALPPNYNSGNTIEENRTASQKKLDEWDTPARDGYLYAEHGEFYDFETCMISKGWERVDFLPHSAIDKANQEYLNRHGRKSRGKGGLRENVTTLDPVSQNPAPYKDLNN